VARFNAATHGLTAETPVIPGVERQEDWDAFREPLVERLALVGALEAELAGRLAALAPAPPGPLRTRVHRRFDRARPEDFLEHPLKRGLPRTIKEADESVETVERGLRLLDGLADAPISTEVSDQDVDSIFEALTRDDPGAKRLLEGPLPGFDEGIANADDWTAPLLRVAFSVLAERWGVTSEELLAHTVEQVRTVAAECAEERAAMLAEQDRMRRERILPDASTLHALTRYEANLHRMCVQTMHELEAAQARPNGHAAPLARVDLQLLERP
jgi:hypothetical protein